MPSSSVLLPRVSSPKSHEAGLSIASIFSERQRIIPLPETIAMAAPYDTTGIEYYRIPDFTFSTGETLDISIAYRSFNPTAARKVLVRAPEYGQSAPLCHILGSLLTMILFVFNLDTNLLWRPDQRNSQLRAVCTGLLSCSSRGNAWAG